MRRLRHAADLSGSWERADQRHDCLLDDPNAVAPETQLGVESRVSWLDAALATPEERTEQWLATKNLADAGSRQHPDREG